MTHRRDLCRSSWCDIYQSRISKNLELACNMLPSRSKFCAVLKADAYGHGIKQVVPLVTAQGITCIGITSNAEARAVREAGFTGDLIRLRAATLAEMDSAAFDHVQEQIGSLDAARQYRSLLDGGHDLERAHLALDAEGMSRDGLDLSTDAGKAACMEMLALLGGHVTGICTHFSSNEPAHLQQNSVVFQQQVGWVLDNSDLQRSDLIVHAGSSLTLVSDVPIETDMYRCGAIIYGILKPELGFVPTMELKAHVVGLGAYPQGATVGYDRANHLDRDSRLACISIGYANGFYRHAHNRSAVIIKGQVVPVLGKMSMNTIVADVTKISGVQVGDVVTVFGGTGAGVIEKAQAEAQFGTIMADLYSDWGLRNHRVYR
ncbi:alanine racemase [Sulfitobacter mediterraneus]|uniref:alanine racemase n=1 Tax=Sulfitobacter mediterraneus TaxID=83219 RepID=UPI0024919A6D|nr:alanine racemase [Sulfitobacter mediterraneus]